MHYDIGMVLIGCGGGATTEELIGILTMNNLDSMTSLCQFIRELVNKNRVAAEMVGRIKRGDHAKAHMKRPDDFRMQTALCLLSWAPRRAASSLPHVDDLVINHADRPSEGSATHRSVDKPHYTAPPRHGVANEVVGE